jgi:hypothetical protein
MTQASSEPDRSSLLPFAAAGVLALAALLWTF